MRIWIFITAVAVLAGGGCTHLSLRRNTVKQASTLTDLQYQQVLDNLAMFACNPEALPWHLKLSAGSTQVSDEGTARFDLGFGGGNPAAFLPGSQGVRGLVEVWSGVPAVDPDDLEVLQLAYRRAIDPSDSLGVRPKIYEKMCELSVAYNIVLSEETLNAVIDAVEPEKPDPDIDKKRWDWKRRNKELRKRLEDQFKILVKLSDLRTAEAVKGAPEDPAKALWAQQQQSDLKFALTQGRVGVEDEIVKLTREIIDLPTVSRYPFNGRPEHNIHEVDQIQAKIKTLQELAESGKYCAPWFCTSRNKQDVPECACYVGHACSCGCECYVWIMPEQRAMLRDFTTAVLTLAPLERSESTVPTPAGGILYSPTLSR